jgi:hypothetical protein
VDGCRGSQVQINKVGAGADKRGGTGTNEWGGCAPTKACTATKEPACLRSGHQEPVRMEPARRAGVSQQEQDGQQDEGQVGVGTTEGGGCDCGKVGTVARVGVRDNTHQVSWPLYLVVPPAPPHLTLISSVPAPPLSL